jgi:hypothetical protein
MNHTLAEFQGALQFGAQRRFVLRSNAQLGNA